MVSKRYDEEDNENNYNSLNIFIRLASDLLRKLCSNDSVREQVTAFDGIPVCLRYIHTVPICMYVCQGSARMLIADPYPGNPGTMYCYTPSLVFFTWTMSLF